MEGAHFRAVPAHGLQRRVVVAQLAFPAEEVLLLEDGQPRVTVVLQTTESWVSPPGDGWDTQEPLPLARPLSPKSALRRATGSGKLYKMLQHLSFHRSKDRTKTTRISTITVKNEGTDPNVP